MVIGLSWKESFFRLSDDLFEQVSQSESNCTNAIHVCVQDACSNSVLRQTKVEKILFTNTLDIIHACHIHDII